MNVLSEIALGKRPDNRLMLSVFLLTDGRPRYHKIFCMNCGEQLGSVEGTEIYMVRDVDDGSFNADKARLNIRCNGKYCRTWYRFTLN